MSAPQQILEDAVERMGLYVGKHPTGALTLGANGSTRVILPQENGWLVQEKMDYGGTKVIGAFTFEDVDKLVHKTLRWSWRHPFKH